MNIKQKQIWWLAAAIFVLLVVFAGGVALWARGYVNGNTNNISTDVDHDVYEALYEAAWRADQGVGNATMTATLLTPNLRAALAEDDSRGQTDDQIWQAVKKQDDNEVTVVVTYDSVSAYIPDGDFVKKLALTASSGEKFTTEKWQAISSPSTTANQNIATKSQMGVLFFRAEKKVDWDNVRDLRLTATGVGDQKTRIFIWAQPSALSGE